MYYKYLVYPVIIFSVALGCSSDHSTFVKSLSEPATATSIHVKQGSSSTMLNAQKTEDSSRTEQMMSCQEHFHSYIIYKKMVDKEIVFFA